MSLRFSEEIVLLSLDDKTGKVRPLPDRALDLAVSGALLMELAFENRIDTDDKHLKVFDRSDHNDPLLDRVMKALPDEDLTIRNALSRVALDASDLRLEIFTRLIIKGILRQEEHKYFFVLSERRYPMVDDTEEQEVISRIRDVIVNATIPDPKDVVLICLMDACDLGTTVFTEKELEQYQDRIKQVARMDFIGQALARAIQEIQEAILETITYMGI